MPFHQIFIFGRAHNYLPRNRPLSDSCEQFSSYRQALLRTKTQVQNHPPYATGALSRMDCSFLEQWRLLNQLKYIQRALQAAQMPECNAKDSPLPSNATCHAPTDEDVFLTHLTRSSCTSIGKLRWFSDFKRPYIAFAVSRLV